MLQIRPAVTEDIPCLEQLEQTVIEAERPFNRAIKAKNARYYDLPALLNDESSYLIVGMVEGNVIATGYAQIRQSKAQLDHDNHGYLGFMYVHPMHRGKGFNQQIMTELLAWCNKRSVYDFYLDVYSDNAAAIRAYEKAGFTPCLLEMKLHQNK